MDLPPFLRTGPLFAGLTLVTATGATVTLRHNQPLRTATTWSSSAHAVERTRHRVMASTVTAPMATQISSAHQ